MGWQPGDRLTHRFNPDLGPGVVERVGDRTLLVHFPDTETTLQMASDSSALERLELSVGSRASLRESGEQVRVAGLPEEGRVELEDGRVVGESQLWPAALGDTPFERLAGGEVESLEAFSLRMDSLHLARLHSSSGFGSFLGGRIRLFPHQLHAAERATRNDPARWLFADEVGLGKTVEACLVLDHLVRTGRAERTLVVVPETLTVQWLGELWRKYHQVFVLLDEQRLADVERDHGSGFNPFDAYRHVVVGLEFLVERPWLVRRAVETSIDLLIVDEAHHLRRPPGHPGNPEYRAIEPIAALGRHVLLLTATPLDEDAHGFFRLLQLLMPEEFSMEDSFEERLANGQPLPPCTSATRRSDIGRLPPRVPAPVDLRHADWSAQLKLEAAVAALPAENPLARRRKIDRMRRALASPVVLEAGLRSEESELLTLTHKAAKCDPRLDWLAEAGARWKRDGDKTLVFVGQRETLETIRTAMSRRVQLRIGVFHEELSTAQRDIEVAQFRLSSGPSMLVSTECGGEGRNFEFCTRLVLFDLPWNPMLVEQRIGRLDRIGRDREVEVVYLRPASALGGKVVDLYESLEVFRAPLAGIEPDLAGVEQAIGELALAGGEAGDDPLMPLVREARVARDRIRRAALHQLHRDPYDPELGKSILKRIPDHIEELTRDVILEAAEQLNLHVEEHRRGTRHSIELTSSLRVDSLPGVPPDSSYLGTFDRDEAVRDETIDFYAAGHPLVDGILAQLADSSLGRVALLDVRAEQEGFGLIAVYREGAELEAVAVDSEGSERPDWAQRILERPVRSRRVDVERWVREPRWPTLVRALAARFDGPRRPEAVAAVRFGP